MKFWFKKTRKDIIVTKQDKKIESINICRFSEKEIIDKKRKRSLSNDWKKTEARHKTLLI